MGKTMKNLLDAGSTTASLNDADLILVAQTPFAVTDDAVITWGNIKSLLQTNFDTRYLGWVEVTDSWSYASATTIGVPSDATTIYQVGDRIRWKQGGAYKYGMLKTIATTLLTIDTSTDYTVANSAITNVAYSRVTNPFGFPSYFNWSPTAGGYTLGDGTQVARFFRTGKWIDFVYSLTLGGTSSISGDFNISLPVTPSPDFQGFADLTDAGSASYIASAVSGSGNLFIRAVNVAGTYPTNSTTFSATVPFTWVSGDNIRAAGKYLTA
jgi:hypothetical protein